MGLMGGDCEMVELQSWTVAPGSNPVIAPISLVLLKCHG
jgi:hypothetical protein